MQPEMTDKQKKIFDLQDYEKHVFFQKAMPAQDVVSLKDAIEEIRQINVELKTLLPTIQLTNFYTRAQNKLTAMCWHEHTENAEEEEPRPNIRPAP